MIREALGKNVAATRSDDSPATSAVTPTGWASMAGRFQLLGTAPPNPKIDITADKDMCAPGNRTVYAERVLASSDGGLKNVVIVLSSEIPTEEPWVHPDVQSAGGNEVIFDQKECVFLSHVGAMRVGQTLLIKNSDPGGHNTKIESKKNVPFNQTIPAAGTVKYVPTKAETAGPVLVKCSIHPWMTAHLLVHGNGYFAVSDENGRFEIPNLPAGVPLEFRIWHEAGGFLDGVGIAGTKTKKGRFMLTLDPQDTSLGQLDVKINAEILQ